MRETDAGMEGTFKVQSRVAARQGELSLLAAQKHRVEPYTCRLAMTATPQLPCAHTSGLAIVLSQLGDGSYPTRTRTRTSEQVRMCSK